MITIRMIKLIIGKPCSKSLSTLSLISYAPALMIAIYILLTQLDYTYNRFWDSLILIFLKFVSEHCLSVLSVLLWELFPEPIEYLPLRL